MSLLKIIEGSHIYSRLMYTAQIFPYLLLGPSLLTLRGVDGIFNAVKVLSGHLTNYASTGIKSLRTTLGYNNDLFFGTLQYNVSRLAVLDLV